MSKVNLVKLNEAIKMLGGIGPLALSLGMSYQSIVEWRGQRRKPTPLSCKKIEKATGGKIKAEELLPDFSWDEWPK